MCGHDVLNNSFLNKGATFTIEERKELGLLGILPPYIQTIEEQAEQVYQHFLCKPSNLEKRHSLMEIPNTNRTLFYCLLNQHVAEFNPIVHDPVIAETIEEYSELYADPQYATYLDINHPENIGETLRNVASDHDTHLIVVTNAEGILGIGDWSVQDVDISVGKLMTYTVAVGIDPASVIPLVIDAGTNRKELLKDPVYPGNHHERVTGDKYYEFIDKFVQTAENMFPKLYLHWEDSGRSNATNIPNKYKKEIPTSNDDIQGIGIVILGGIFGAMDIMGEKLTDQVYLCYGGGSAGVGITSRVHAEMVSEELSSEEAYEHFFTIDKQGLLFDDMEDLTPAQKPFTKKHENFVNCGGMTKFPDAIEAVKPTILVGTSTDAGVLIKEVVETVCESTERLVIFLISNSTKKLETTVQQVIEWSDGKTFVATGVPSGTISYRGVDYQIGQANNALIYPGPGLGMLASEASLLIDEMVSATAHLLSGLVDPDQPGTPVLLPSQYVVEVSIKVAEAVAKKVRGQGLAQVEEKDMAKAARDLKWCPKY